MMGNSSRFKAEGYGDKYKICLQGHSLFYLSVRSFKNYFQTSEFIFVIPSYHQNYNFLKAECKKLGLNRFTIIELDQPTLGQAHTVAIACKNIKSDKEIVVFNIDSMRLNFKTPCLQKNVYGWLEVFPATGKQWSYAKFSETGSLIESAEKKEISNYASNGLYAFLNSAFFLRIYEEHYEKDLNAKEHYIAPIYNTAKKYGDIQVIKTKARENIFCGVPKEYIYLKKNLNLLDEIFN